MISRRDFCRKGLLVAGGLFIPLSALETFKPGKVHADRDTNPVRWGFLVDTHACVGCGFCVKACKVENEVPEEAAVTRTWVERYVVTRDGKTHPDSPRGALDGFVSPEIETGHGKTEKISAEDITKAFF